MNDPNNPRAFPSAAIDDRYGGMTLWDYYAGQALAGFCADEGCPPPAHAAKAIADYADAMLAERAKRMPTADDHLAPAAKALHDAGLLTAADYHRTINRIDAAERVREGA